MAVQTKFRIVPQTMQFPDNEDIFQHIINYLFVDELFAVRIASSELKKIIKARTELLDTGPLAEVTDGSIRQLVRLFPSATRVCIPLGKLVSIDVLAESLHQWNMLAQLKVQGVKWCPTPQISKFSVRFKHEPPLKELFPSSNILQELRITGDIFLKLDDLMGLVVSPYLKVLELKGLRSVNDQEMNELLMFSTRHPPNLKRLLLSDCTQIKEFDVPVNTLKDLDLSHDLGLTCFRSPLPNLLTVDLSFCTSLTNAGVDSLIKLAPGLQHVRLIGCARVSHLDVISDNLCSSLLSLKIGGVKVRTVKTAMCIGLRETCFFVPCCALLDLRYLPITSLIIHIKSTLFRRLCLSGCNALESEKVNIVEASGHPSKESFFWGRGRSCRKPKYDVIICGTPLSASSFPDLASSKVKGAGEPMEWFPNASE